jgi:hypothetical protein
MELKNFYKLMFDLKNLKKSILKKYIKNLELNEELEELKKYLKKLESLTSNNYNASFSIDGKNIQTDISYEIKELKKDIILLEKGEENLISDLKISEELDYLIKNIKQKTFDTFVTDRDGTINNYCARYQSSIQSIYNALFLYRFNTKNTKNPIIITSAPLEKIGIIDISIDPKNTFIYGASKGREFIDLKSKKYTFPIEKEKQEKLNILNKELALILSKKEYEKFSLIGSGLQFKFGQTTIARQDIMKSVSEKESLNFLNFVKSLVKKLDPRGSFFRIEDTGKDIEIILTIDSKEKNLKDFDKGDGLNFIKETLKLNFENKNILVCGDTFSDVKLVEKAAFYTDKVTSIFITEDEKLKKEVSIFCKDSFFVSKPDSLVTFLNKKSL